MLPNGTFPGISSVFGRTFVTLCWRTQPPLIRRGPDHSDLFVVLPKLILGRPQGAETRKERLARLNRKFQQASQGEWDQLMQDALARPDVTPEADDLHPLAVSEDGLSPPYCQTPLPSRVPGTTRKSVAPAQSPTPAPLPTWQHRGAPSQRGQHPPPMAAYHPAIQQSDSPPEAAESPGRRGWTRAA